MRRLEEIKIPNLEEPKIRKNAKIYQILLLLESSSKDRVLKKLQFGNFGVKIFLTCS